MSIQAPRNLREWQKAVEQKLAAAKSGTRIAIEHGTKAAEAVHDELESYKDLTPAAPIELTVQTSIYVDANKRQRGQAIFDFPDVTFATNGTPISVDRYEIWGQDQGLNPLQPFRLLNTSAISSVYATDLKPGSTWKFKLRARSSAIIKPGLFTADQSVTVTADTTAPPQLSTPTAIAVSGGVKLTWDGLAAGGGALPGDFSHAEIAFGMASSPTAIIDTFPGASFTIIPKTSYNQVHYFRIRGVDTSGNVGAWSPQATAIPTPLVDVDIILSQIDAASTIITNIGAEALKDGAVLSAKLADNAVTLGKIAGGAVDLTKLSTAVNDKITKGITDAATAQTAANTANTAAGTAQTAADAAKAQVQAIVAGGSNMIFNGDFERPITSPPEGWPTRSLTYVEASANARSGANVMRAAPTTAAPAYGYSDYVATGTGRIIYIEYYVRLREALVPANAGMALRAYFSWVKADGSSSAQSVGDSSAYGYAPVFNSALSTTAWTKVVHVYKLTATDIVKARFGPATTLLAAAGNSFEFDDVRVVDITDSYTALTAAATAQQKADAAFADAATALTNAGLAQTSADGKNSVYYGSSAPAGSGFKANDTWYRSPDNAVFRWSGSAWVNIQDTSIATAKSAADAAATAASTADGKAVAAQTKANKAETDAATAQTAANNANTAAQTADGKAVTAQTKANQAFTDAGAAQTAANNAATAASTADGKAVNAQTTATNAQTAATNAQTAATNAATLAGSVVKTSTSAATGTPPSVGALWNQTNAAGDLIIATWTANAAGTAWVLRKLDNAVFGNINAATINAGFLDAARLRATDIRTLFLTAGKITANDIVAGTLTSASGVFGTMDASIINSGTINAARLNATDIRTLFLTAGKVTANDIVAGTLTSASGVFGTMDASVINSGTINAARLNATDIRTLFLTAGKVTANDMVAGTITAASGIIGSLDAAKITTGTLDTARLNAGAVRAAIITAGKITAADMVTGTITAASGIIGSLDIGKVTTGEMSGSFITANTITARQIVVRDTTNIWEDPYFKLGLSGYGSATGWSYDAALNSGKGAIKYTNSSTGTVYMPMLPVAIPVAEGSVLYFAADVAVTGTGNTPNFNLRVYCYNKDGVNTNLGVPLDNNADKNVSWTSGLTSSYVTYSGRLAIPAGTVSIQFRPTFYSPTGTGENYYISNVRIFRAANADLIVDGTMTAGKLNIAGNPADPDEVALTANFAKLMKLEVSNLIATTGNLGTAVIDKLWTDVVNSRKINAQMLTLSNNHNLLDDGDFNELATNTPWTLYSDATIAPDSGRANTNALKCTSPGTRTGSIRAQQYRKPLKAGDKYIASGWIYHSVAPTTTTQVRMTAWYKKIDGTSAGSAHIVGVPVSRAAGWYFYESSAMTVPALTEWTDFQLNVDSAYTGNVVFDDINLLQQVDANLVVDGAIVARHLTVDDTLWAKVIKFKQLGGDEINVNDLTANTSWIGVMRGGILINDAVTTSVLKADAITAKHTITGATFQTTTTANRGIKFTSAGLNMWDAGGKNTLSADAATGYLTITGRVRTAPDGQPGAVLIPPAESTDGKTMALWLTPDTAVLPGGVTAGVWMSNPVGGLATAGAINVRGQSHGGVDLHGRVELISTDGSIARISSDNGYGLQITAYAGNAYLAASTGEARISSALNTFINIGTGKQLTLQSGGAAYNRTNGSAANAIIFTDGNVFKVSSASKYKIDPRPMDLDPRILDDVTVKDWIDLGMAERYAESYEHQWPYNEQEQWEFDALSLERIPGTIAEDVEAAGGEKFVVRDLDGEIDSLMYDRLALARTEILKARVAAQAAELAELRGLIEELMASRPA